MEFIIEEDIDTILNEIRTKENEADVEKYVKPIAAKYGYEAEDFLTALSHTATQEELSNGNLDEVLHYHRTNIDAAIQIINSGALQGRSTRAENGEDISKLGGGSSQRVQFTRDENKNMGYMPGEDSLGAHGTDVVFVFDSNIFKEDSYSTFGPYPTVEKISLSDACVTILAKDKEIREKIQETLKQKGLTIPINMQDDFNRDLHRTIVEQRKPMTPIQEKKQNTVSMPQSNEQIRLINERKRAVLDKSRRTLIERQQKIAQRYSNETPYSDKLEEELRQLEYRESLQGTEAKIAEVDFDISLCDININATNGIITENDKLKQQVRIMEQQAQHKQKSMISRLNFGIERANIELQIATRDGDYDAVEEAKSSIRDKTHQLQRISNQNFNTQKSQPITKPVMSKQVIGKVVDMTKSVVTSDDVERQKRNMISIAREDMKGKEVSAHQTGISFGNPHDSR